jgi:hypothetical protein
MTTAHEIVTPVGRLVSGHPMEQHPVTDDQGQQKVGADGQPRTESYLALAIPKGAEGHWAQTQWGAIVWQAGVEGWPNGEYNAPTFAWKITDGDSTVPNKRGKRPVDREGWPGHWVVHMSTGLPIKCFHAGRYDPAQQIQDKNAIKRGDYIRVCLNVRANNPSPSPGVYLNPVMVELNRAGVEIQGDGPDPAAAFGQTPAELPANAELDPNANAGAQPAQPAPAPAPAPAPGPQPTPEPNHDFVANAGQPGAAPAPEPAPAPQPAQPQMTAKANGIPYQDFIAKGWTDELLIQHGYMTQ